MRWRWPWQRSAALVDDTTDVEMVNPIAVEAVDARKRSEEKLAEARRTAIRVNRMVSAHEEILRVDGLPGALSEALRRRPTT